MGELEGKKKENYPLPHPVTTLCQHFLFWTFYIAWVHVGFVPLAGYSLTMFLLIIHRVGQVMFDGYIMQFVRFPYKISEP